MSWNNKVVWSEGMFMRPHHFQQHDRYIENLVESRCSALGGYAWGFKELKIDKQQLTLGKLSITAAKGVFPDGTPFSIPDDYEPPSPLDVPENSHDTVVYLALPTRRFGGDDASDIEDPEALSRYRTEDYEVRDSNAGNENAAKIRVGQLRTRLLLENDKKDEYSCLGIARISESRADKNVLLDEKFIPSVVDCHANPILSAFTKEVLGLLHHRGEALAARVSASGRGGAAEIADFMMLQVVNRYEPLLAHISQQSVHPESLYRLALEVVGELCTFTSKRKRPAKFPPYQHHDLQGTFGPVVAELRQSLSMVLEQNAVSLPLEPRQHGIRVAPIADRNMLAQATFVLAVSASMPTEEIRKRFPAQAKIGPVEQIRKLVQIQLPGIALRPLPVAPRQIPYHSGSVYFEMDRASDMFKQMKNSGGFAIHLGGEFPGIEIALWAIRG